MNSPSPIPEPGLAGRATPALDHTAAFDAAMGRAFGVVAYTMNRFLIDHMLRAARRFGSDYEALIVWGVLAHQNVAHLIPPGTLPSSLLDDEGHLPDAQQRVRAVRLRDLAQITRIPRETVRRKLEMLRNDGWILRSDDGWVLNVDAVGPEVREFQFDVARRFLATADVVRAALHDASQAQAQAAARTQVAAARGA